MKWGNRRKTWICDASKGRELQTQLLSLAVTAQAASTAFLAGKWAFRQATNVRSALCWRGAGESYSYHDRVKAFVVKGCELVWDKPLLTEKPREYKMAQQELFMAVQSPFTSWHNHLQEQRWQCNTSGDLWMCHGWKQGLHLLHRLYKWAPCL